MNSPGTKNLNFFFTIDNVILSLRIEVEFMSTVDGLFYLSF